MKLLKWIDESTFRTKEYKNPVPFWMRGARKVRVIPDGYFVIEFQQAEQPDHFFLEVDRGTMSNSRWQGKVKAYVRFRAAGLSQEHYGTENFRVLTVTTSQQRLQNLKGATEAAGGKFYFWFTTQEQVDIWLPQRFLEAAWAVAGTEKTFSLLT